MKEIDRRKYPLLAAVEEYIAAGRVRMHTPGHSKKKNSALPLLGDICKYDITELDGLESLYSGTGAIAASERRAADILGVKGLFYSAGGSTLCIQAMLYMAASGDGKVIFAGGLHKSAINTCILLNITPVFIKSLDKDTCGRIKEILYSQSDVRAVYITNPDYYGRIYDTSELYNICRDNNIPLLVDGAHGAHLSCFDESINTLHMGASMTAQSAHKTLPALTGGAWLCVHEDKYLHNAKYAMSMFGSTSPSYLIMLSLEAAANWLEDEGAESFIRIADKCSAVKSEALRCNFKIYTGLSDPARITLDASSLGISGRQASELFRGNGIEPEMHDGSRVVFIPSPFMTDAEFERLTYAVKAVGVRAGYVSHTDKKEEGGPYCGCGETVTKDSDAWHIDMRMTPRAASLAECETLLCDEAAGRIAGEIICPCPPGTPITVPGGVIDADAVQTLKSYGIFTVKVVK